MLVSILLSVGAVLLEMINNLESDTKRLQNKIRYVLCSTPSSVDDIARIHPNHLFCILCHAVYHPLGISNLYQQQR